MASNPFGPAPTQQPAKSPRRRQGALNDHGANPIKQRQATLKELTEVLHGIPRAYQQADFSAIAQAIRIIDTGELVSSAAELERCCSAMDACLKKVSAVYEAGFTSALSAYSVIFDHVEPVKEHVATMRQQLRGAAQAITPCTAELHNMLLQLETTEHILALLVRIEALSRAPEQVAAALEAKQWGAAARSVAAAARELLGDDLLPIAALEPLRKRMLDLRNIMPELLLAELKAYVYLYSPHIPAGYVAARLAGDALPSPTAVRRAPDDGRVLGRSSGASPALSRVSGATSPRTLRKGAASHRRGRSIAAAVDSSALTRANDSAAADAAGPDSDGAAQPVDRADVSRYVAQLVAALGVLDKAASGANELAHTADAAHRRLVAGELSAAQSRRPAAAAAPPMRHALCCARADVRIAHALLADAAPRLCDRLAVVMLHHAAVADCVAAAAPAGSGRFTPERQWESAQRALLEQLERLLRADDRLLGEPGADVLPASPVAAVAVAAEAEDTFFRFAASSAAFTAAPATPQSSAPPLRSDSSFGEASLLLSPAAAAAGGPALDPSPLHLAALQVPLATLLRRVRARGLLADDCPLAAFLLHATAAAYVPLLRVEYGRLIAAAFAAQDWARVAAVAAAAAHALQADGRDAPAMVALFDALAVELFAAVVGGADARLAALTLHTMTAKRLNGMQESDVIVSGGEVLSEPSDVAAMAALAQTLGALCELRPDDALLPSWRTVVLPQLSAQRQQLRLAVQYELRNQCHHHLTRLARDQYYGVQPPDTAHEADASVRTFANNVVAFLDAVYAVTPAFGFGQLSKLIASTLVAFAASLPRIDAGGMLKMHLNAFLLQQRLSALLQTEEDEQQFERISAYYALVTVRVPTLIRLLAEGAVTHVFRFEEYVTLFERRVMADELDEDSIRSPAVRAQLQKALSE